MTAEEFFQVLGNCAWYLRGDFIRNDCGLCPLQYVFGRDNYAGLANRAGLDAEAIMTAADMPYPSTLRLQLMFYVEDSLEAGY